TIRSKVLGTPESRDERGQIEPAAEARHHLRDWERGVDRDVLAGIEIGHRLERCAERIEDLEPPVRDIRPFASLDEASSAGGAVGATLDELKWDAVPFGELTRGPAHLARSEGRVDDDGAARREDDACAAEDLGIDPLGERRIVGALPEAIRKSGR